MRQRAWGMHLDLPLEGRRRERPRSAGPDQDPRGALCRDRGGDRRPASVRAAGDHRAAGGARPVGVPGMDRRRDLHRHRLMRIALLLLIACCTLARAALGPEPDLLEPEKAFHFAARLKDARSIEVSYEIAPGYYMYRDKFRFALAPQDAKPGAPQLPPGKLKRDEFFGEVETYRGNVTILVPFELAQPDVPAVTITATSQGCADVGVCYVPVEQKAQLRLAAAGGAASDAPLAQVLGLDGAKPGADDARIARLF